MKRKMLHQVGRPLENVSDVAKQIVGLAGHNVSPHSAALVFNVSPSAAWFQTCADLKAILRASSPEQENRFFELAQNTRMSQTWKNPRRHPYT